MKFGSKKNFKFKQISKNAKFISKAKLDALILYNNKISLTIEIMLLIYSKNVIDVVVFDT